MKRALTFLATALVLFTACKKDETAEAKVTGNWILGANSYKVAFSNKGATSGGTSSTLIMFADAVPNGTNTSQLNTFNMSFKVSPTTTGSYELVSLGTSTLTDKQFQVFAGGPAGVYAYLGAPVTVNVTVTGGKVQFTLPEITVKSTASGQPDVKLSASVAEM